MFRVRAEWRSITVIEEVLETVIPENFPCRKTFVRLAERYELMEMIGRGGRERLHGDRPQDGGSRCDQGDEKEIQRDRTLRSGSRGGEDIEEAHHPTS
jgi:hypothetical protein